MDLASRALQGIGRAKGAARGEDAARGDVSQRIGAAQGRSNGSGGEVLFVTP